ncbi:MAG: cytidylate kinase-like family protein, partial [Desulfobacterales bacterium]
ARRILEKDDEERRKWSQRLYGIDTADPSLYDLVFHIKQLTVDDTVDMICDCISKEQFKTTPESQRMIEDLALSAAIERALIDIWTDVTVCVDNHIAFIEIQAPIRAEERLIKEIREVAGAFEEISDVRIKCNRVVALSE